MLNLIRTKTRSKTFRISFIALLVVVILFTLFARGGSTSASPTLNDSITCEKGQWDRSPYFTGDATNCPNILEFLFKPAFIDERASEFNLRFSTFPAGIYGMSMKNSGWVTESYFVDIDTSDSSRIYNKDGTTSQGATLKAKMNKKRSLFLYPFDSYHGEIRTQAIAEVSKQSIPITLIASKSTLAGWKIHFSEANKPLKVTSNKALYDKKPAKLFWQLDRASVVYLSVSVLVFLMLIALGSAFAITRSIANKRRPPSMNLLLWLATILFAILQVRSNFPGNPPIGILLDFMVVFPVLGLLLILGIANTFYWLNRSDWDYENENPELMKNA